MFWLCSPDRPRGLVHSVLMGLVLGTAGLSASGQDPAFDETAPDATEKLPTAEAIINRYIEVTGGREAYEKLRNMVIKRKVETQGVTFQVEEYYAAPDLYLQLAESAKTGKISKGYDGSVAWMLSINKGPRILDGLEEDSVVFRAQFNPMLNWHRQYSSAYCSGLGESQGQACWMVVLKTPKDYTETRFYSQKTGLLLETVIPSTDRRLPPQKILFKDYKEADGIRMPWREEHTKLIHKIVHTIESVAFNVEMPPDRFVPPPEVRNLEPGD